MLLLKPFFKFSTLASKIASIQTPYNNLNPKILALADRNLLQNNIHPLGIICNQIKTFFQDPKIVKSEWQNQFPKSFVVKDDFSPIVSTQQNFEDLLIPLEHVSRKKTDTYYINETTCLRTHTSAHQTHMLRSNISEFCVFGDVYRRDTIDCSHYPLFHQMESVRVYPKNIFTSNNPDYQLQTVVVDLQQTLENLVRFLFGNIQMRWVPGSFPFTDPSYELEIFFNGEWMEMLGCGIIHKNVLKNGGRTEDEIGWAAGLGIERFAMLLFDITDIRLFWSEDSRVLDQFKDGKIKKFVPFSKYPICYKDFTFWIPSDFEENELFEVVRNIGGDLIEKVECRDTYVDKKKEKTSKCYRIHFRSLERTLQNSEINVLQARIREDFTNLLKLELR